LIVNTSGVSLVELLASVVVLSVLASLIYLVWFTGISAWRDQHQGFTARHGVQLALTRMARELRGASGVVQATTGRLVFLGPDGSTVTYELRDGDRLVRFDGEKERVLGTGVGSCEFVLSDDRKLVTITLTSVEVEGRRYDLRTKVRLRDPG